MSFSKSIRNLFLVAAAASAGWFAARSMPAKPAAMPDAGRRVVFYQSPMHPWIKSDQPGNCTICGMKLVPVYDGETSAKSSSENLVTLSQQSIDVLHVSTAPVTRQPLRRSLHVAGQIDDNDSAHRRLSATAEGRIEKLYVPSVGAEVTAGQPLLSFFSRELIVARGEYLLAGRQPPSLERETALAGSRQKLRRMGLTLAQIDKLPEQTGDNIELLAPISGTVVERKVYEGQYVKEGDVLFEIADFSKMWFVGEVYERDLAWVKVGQTVEVSTPTVPGKIYAAPIEFIDPNVMSETRTARLRVVLENPPLGDPARHQHELLHRVYANGLIRVETPETLTVPRAAVLMAGGPPLVYVVKSEGVYEPREVKLGRVGDDAYEIVSGLSETERVVLNGNLLIDAQAQLDRGGRPEAPVETSSPLTEAQRANATSLLKFADALAQRLAADDLAGFNALVPQRPSVENLPPSVSAPTLRPAPDLPMARKTFQPLADGLATWAAALRADEPAFAAVKIYRCPMSADSFPGAPAKAAWTQLSGPIRNPYFGREMPECGEEVKP